MKYNSHYDWLNEHLPKFLNDVQVKGGWDWNAEYIANALKNQIAKEEEESREIEEEEIIELVLIRSSKAPNTQPINAIKKIRALMGIALKEATMVFDNALSGDSRGQVLYWVYSTRTSKPEMEVYKKELESFGCTVEIRKK